MSAIEWLKFITPFTIIVVAIALLASIPLKQAWRKHYLLPTRRLAFKKTEIIALSITVIGWVLAWIATTIMTPIIQVNVQATSELLLTITLTILGLIILVRIFQKNNMLSLWLVMFKRQLPFIAEIITPIIAVTGLLIASTLEETSRRHRDEAEKGDPNTTDLQKSSSESGMNLNGEYYGQSKSIWYGDSNKKRD
ncbi:MAG: hypothetical protein K2Q14_04675 [Gammaproteobacteria bacterium]|nr:hypothetical protein [Gammaproteobacteria bacterium]MBY0544826.1 hypothetical protein [Gammaproteobacteria bacterium]